MIDVIIPVHDSKETLQETLDSVISIKDLRVIVIQDRASEGTLELVKVNRVSSIESKVPGAYHARRVGLENSSSEFVIFLDSDDVLEDGWIKGLSVLQFEPSIVGVGGNVLNFGPRRRKLTDYPVGIENTRSLLSRGYSPWPISGSIWRRETLLKSLHMTPSPLVTKYAEDYELVIRASLLGGIRTLPNVMCRYRISNGKSQTNPAGSLNCAANISQYYNEILGFNFKKKTVVEIYTLRRQVQVSLYNHGWLRTAFSFFMKPETSLKCLGLVSIELIRKARKVCAS